LPLFSSFDPKGFFKDPLQTGMKGSGGEQSAKSQAVISKSNGK